MGCVGGCGKVRGKFEEVWESVLGCEEEGGVGNAGEVWERCEEVRRGLQRYGERWEGVGEQVRGNDGESESVGGR